MQHLRIEEKCLYISNSCVLPNEWDAEKILQHHKSMPYNPDIANVFYRAGYIESWGRGIQKICEECKNHGISNPEYDVLGRDLTVKFFTKNKPVNRILTILEHNPSYSQEKIANKMNVSRATVTRLLAKLVNENKIQRIGADKEKLLKIGADYSSNGFYGMLNGILRFEDYTKKGATKSDLALASITIDNYFEYSLEALKFQLSVPVTLRTTELVGGRAADPSYFTYEAKVNYSLDSMGIYALVGSKALSCGKIFFGSGEDGEKDIEIGDTFTMQIKPGVTFNVGNVGFDIGAEFNIGPKGLTYNEDGTAADKNSFDVNLPFKATISF